MKQHTRDILDTTLTQMKNLAPDNNFIIISIGGNPEEGTQVGSTLRKYEMIDCIMSIVKEMID